jgi:hypothetical protein
LSKINVNLVFKLFVNIFAKTHKSQYIIPNMKQLFFLTLIFSSTQTIKAQNVALASARKDSLGVFIGDMRATERMENVGTARKFAMVQLKKNLDVLEKGKPNNVFADERDITSQDRNLNTDTYAMYIARLDKKYKNDVRTIETDNIRDIFQIEQKSEIKRRLSGVVSAQCFNNKNDGQFIKLRDLDGDEVIGFPLESFKGNPRYGLVENYHQGFARIKKDQVFGFLNLCGDESIPCQYDKAEPFNDGKALVKKFDWYYVDVYGNESEALENVTEARSLKFGISIAKFKNGKVALIDNNFDVSKKPISDLFDGIEPFNGELYKVRNGKLYGLIKIDGTLKIDVAYDNLNPAAESAKWMIIEQNKKVGLMDTDGNIKIKPNYEYINSFSVDPSIAPNLTLGFAKDEAGVRLVDFKDLRTSKVYTSISEFNKYGLAIIRDGKNSGYINTDLKVVIEPIYKTLGNFNQYGLASACKDIAPNVTKCGYIKFDGSELIPLQYDEVSNFKKYGMVVVSETVKNCSQPSGTCRVDMVFDKSGNMVIGKTNEAAPIGIRYAVTDTILNQTFVVIRSYVPKGNDEKLEYNLVDRYSFKRVTPQSYEYIKKFDSNLMIPVMKDGRWGLIDTTGKVVAKPAYKDIMLPTEGLYGVRFENNKYGFIDKKGKIQVGFDYDEVRPFNNGLSIVSKGVDKLGVINRFNAKIAPCAFREVNILPATKQFELVDAASNKFILNSNGDCVTNCAKFDEIRKQANQ